MPASAQAMTSSSRSASPRATTRRPSLTHQGRFVLSLVRIYREGLAYVLAHEPGIELVGTGQTIEALTNLPRRSRIDVVLYDLRLPSGRLGLRRLREVSPSHVYSVRTFPGSCRSSWAATRRHPEVRRELANTRATWAASSRRRAAVGDSTRLRQA